jgi:magnesium-transporting ATPase (P-type)
MNCDARIEMSADAKYSPEGNGTEVGMLRFLQENDIEVQDLLAKRHREGEHECSIPFGPIRKRQVEVIRPYKGCDYVRVVVKGAPEYVIQHCTKALSTDGEVMELDESERQRILNEEILEAFAKKGLRTILYAYKDMDSDHWEDLQA